MVFIWLLTLHNDIFSFSFRQCLYEEHLKDPFVWFLIVGFLNVVCVLDIVKNFTTGYMNKKTRQTVLKPSKIALHYLKTWFFIDAVAIYFLVRWLMSFSHTTVFKRIKSLAALRFIRVTRIMSVVKNLEWITDMFGLGQMSYYICSILVFAGFVWHYNACFLAFFPSFLKSDFDVQKMSWTNQVRQIYRQNNKTITCLELYAHSLFECMLKFNIGCNNLLSPYLYEEVFFIIYCVLCGYLFKALFFLLTFYAFNLQYSSIFEFEALKIQLKNYLNYFKVTKHAYSTAEKYFNYRHQQHIFSDKFYDLSPSLRLEVCLEVWKHEFENKIILQQYSHPLLNKIIRKFDLDIFLPNDIIYQVNDIIDCLYFLCSGTIAIYSEEECEMYHIHDSEYFGVSGFFLDQGVELRPNTAIAVEPCEVLILSKIDVKKLVETFPRYRNFLMELIKLQSNEYHQASFFSVFNNKKKN